jgi:ribonucleoside-diphosphate reductase alpha chain
LPSSPSLLPESEPEDENGISQSQLARLTDEVIRKLNEGSGQTGVTGRSILGMGSTSAPAGGIAPEIRATGTSTASPTHGPGMEDRGIYHHAADAMREMYDMGDAPSCGVCGAIMVRNGSCYRCMSCGSTSGCS